MPSISFRPQARASAWQALPWPERIATLKLWGHRVGMFTVLNLLDDPAWLALMFC